MVFYFFLEFIVVRYHSESFREKVPQFWDSYCKGPILRGRLESWLLHKYCEVKKINNMRRKQQDFKTILKMMLENHISKAEMPGKHTVVESVLV